MLKSRLLTAIPQRLRASGRAFIAVAHNRNLMRLQLSFGAGWTAEWTFTVALGVVAFRQGGVAAVGHPQMAHLETAGQTRAIIPRRA